MTKILCILSLLIVLVDGSCSPSSRKLLQECSSAGCSPLIIEGGIQVEQCTVEDDTILLTGSFVLQEIFVRVDGITECCKTCANQKECNAWNFCTNEQGCSVPDLFENITASRALVNATVPVQSCILLSKKSSDTSDKGRRPSTEYSSGQIQRVFLPSMPGYNTNSGKNISSDYDFACGFSSKKTRCEVVGSVTEIAAICSADTRCRGFVYGVNSTGETFGVLKGGDRDMKVFTEDGLEDDPSGTVYTLTEQGLESQQPPSESSPSSTDLWIILVSVIGGVFLLSIVAITLTFVIMSKRYTKAVQDNTTAWQLAQNVDIEPLSALIDDDHTNAKRGR